MRVSKISGWSLRSLNTCLTRARKMPSLPDTLSLTCRQSTTYGKLVITRAADERPIEQPNDKESGVKKFLFLHYGFEMPTPEIMGAWGKWFESIADKIADGGGRFPGGREISHSGTRDLPMGPDSITGYSVLHAEDLDEAEQIAKDCPMIASIRVYEIMSK